MKKIIIAISILLAFEIGVLGGGFAVYNELGIQDVTYDEYNRITSILVKEGSPLLDRVELEAIFEEGKE